ncbi:hypothetical protein [Burkholderia sp. SIMBA_062]|uniref:hypothetical protein n=1 Tax=Burkholderia sp. SIMBA_062 TaxID=3085803 RepID=UPI00397CE86E
MINAGIHLYTVAGVLAHKTTTSTKRYAHLVPIGSRKPSRRPDDLEPLQKSGRKTHTP